MKMTKRTVLNLSLCIGIYTICFFVMVLLSGFRYEYKKFKQFILTLVAILLIRYIFLDHIVCLLQALVFTLRSQIKVFSSQTRKEIQHEAGNYEFNDIEYLKLRLKSSIDQLNLSQSHKDEALNCKYKELTKELWFFGKYFFLLLLLVVYSRNTYTYYNTATMRRILNDSYFSSYKMEKVLTINDLYYWINDTFTTAFNEGYKYDGTRIDGPGWLNFYQSKVLGVVRLLQIRHANREKSMTRVYFDKQNYFPQWQRLNKSLPYMDKYWRIYYPWLLQHYEGIGSWLMAFIRIGSLNTYNNDSGYVVLLVRDQNNNINILNYLKANKWLDDQTAAIFIDFTLYSADSNLFTICSILIEQTPFGSLLWQINVQSVELLWNMNEISMWWWLVIILYVFHILQFCKIMILRSWLVSGFFKSRWNCVDFTIVILNILLLSFVLLREQYVMHVTKTFVLAKKQEFVDFRVACFFNYIANIIVGFLICLASIRIWKILQFSSIFRIFNRTLYSCCVPLITTIFGIYIFLFAIGKSAQILNGNYSEIFSGYLKSITSIMSFSFGFNSATSPTDLSHGGNVFGFILYIILMFVVAIFLINMFITLICDHFANARKERDQEPPNKLTYWQFLIMEYSFIAQFFRNVSLQYCKTKNETVSENINHYLDELDKKSQHQDLTKNSDNQEFAGHHILDEDNRLSDRIQNVAAILDLQMKVLDHLMNEYLDCDSEYENSD